MKKPKLFAVRIVKDVYGINNIAVIVAKIERYKVFDMTNEERIYQLCECVMSIVEYELPESAKWIIENVEAIMKDIDNE